jgi:hypothetical protein
MGLGVSFTYSCWFKATSWSTGGGFLTIICKGTPSVNSEYFIVGTPGDLYFYQAFDTANVLASIALGTPTNNVWHHFVIGFDASVNQIFSQFDNGVRVTTNTTTNGIRTSVDPFRFGEAAGQAFSNLAGGRVDEVGLWHRALTTSDVTNLYNGGAGLPLSSFQA